MEVKIHTQVDIDNQTSEGNTGDKAMQDELLKQLHEQYAVNNNANLGTIVTLVVAVIAVIGYFGYVYVHTGVEFSKDFGCLIAEEVNGVNVYYLDALLLIYLASVLVIAILIRLCIYQGVAQRKEQFIIDAIRSKYFGFYYFRKSKNTKANRRRIFPEGYTPYKKEGLQIVQGIYGELVKILKMVFWILTISVSFKILANILHYIVCPFSATYKLKTFFGSISWLGIVEILAVIFLIILLVCIGCKYYQDDIASYEKRKNYYPERKKLLEKIEDHVENEEKGEDKKRWICFFCKSLKQQSEACKAKNKTNQTNNHKNLKQ